MSQKTTIKLQYPIEFAGRNISEIGLRRAKTKDVLNAQKMHKSEEEIQLALIANLAEIEPDALKELDMADYKKVCEAVQVFLS